MELRDYQKDCLAAIASRGSGNWLCQLATGLGKTVIFANLPRSRFSRTLILSHREELVRQPLRYYPASVRTGVLMGTEAPPVSAEIVSASVQTMVRRLGDWDNDAFDTIIVDEAHHAANRSYVTILDHFHPWRVLGFTATPNRGDGLGLEAVFDDIVFQRDLKWGIEHGYLSPIHCKRCQIGYDLSKVASRMGDYATGDLSRALNVDACNDAIAEIVATIAEPPVLIFAVDVAHAEALAAKIPGAVALSAKSENRAEVVEAFKAGRVPVLVNCALFTEGTDLPNVKTVIIARPTKSNALYVQMVGRGTRLAPGKERCLLIDCVGVSRQPICTAPTLLGLDLESVPEKYQADIEGDLLEDIPAVIDQKSDTPESWVKNVSIVNLWARQQGYTLHDVNWQRRPDGSLTITLPVGERQARLTVSAPDLTGKVVVQTSGGYVHEFPAQTGYDWAFEVLRSRFVDCRPLWSLSSAKRWGSKPATKKQVDYIHRFAKRRKVDVSGVMNGLTKLQATSLIDRLKG